MKIKTKIHDPIGSFQFIQYLFGEESRPSLFKLCRRSHVREGESFAEIDLRDRHFWIQDQLFADVLYATVVVIVERCGGVGVYPFVVDLEDEKRQKEG